MEESPRQIITLASYKIPFVFPMSNDEFIVPERGMTRLYVHEDDETGIELTNQNQIDAAMDLDCFLLRRRIPTPTHFPKFRHSTDAKVIHEIWFRSTGIHYQNNSRLFLGILGKIRLEMATTREAIENHDINLCLDFTLGEEGNVWVFVPLHHYYRLSWENSRVPVLSYHYDSFFSQGIKQTQKFIQTIKCWATHIPSITQSNK